MSKKNETKKSAGQKSGGKQSKQAKATEERPVELLIDATGIHSLAPEAPTHEKAPAAKKPVTTEAPQQPDDSGELVVFAFRLTRAERDEIHEAAGSAKASKFVKSVALAAARRDASALQAAIQEAEASRKS